MFTYESHSQAHVPQEDPNIYRSRQFLEVYYDRFLPLAFGLSDWLLQPSNDTIWSLPLLIGLSNWLLYLTILLGPSHFLSGFLSVSRTIA